MIAFALAAACIGLCFFASIKDVTALTIPNWVNAALALCGVAALIASGAGLQVFAWHLGIALVALIFCMGLFFGGLIGGGDAKMIPAVLLWIGPAGVTPFLLATTLAGGALALLLLPLRSALPAGFASADRFASLQSGAGAPYGVAITAGVLYAIPASPTLFALIG